MSLLIRSFLVFFVVFSFDSLLQAEDVIKAREWQNTAGKKMKATMIAKDEDSVTVRMSNSKTYTLQMDQLSEADQEYVRSTYVPIKVRLNVKTTKQSSVRSARGSTRSINVRASGAKGCKLTLYWIGQNSDEDEYGVFEKITEEIENDDYVSDFSVVFNKTSRSFDYQHKAHTIVVRKGDKVLAVYESLGGLKRFADLE